MNILSRFLKKLSNRAAPSPDVASAGPAMPERNVSSDPTDTDRMLSPNLFANSQPSMLMALRSEHFAPSGFSPTGMSIARRFGTPVLPNHIRGHEPAPPDVDGPQAANGTPKQIRSQPTPIEYIGPWAGIPKD